MVIRPDGYHLQVQIGNSEWRSVVIYEEGRRAQRAFFEEIAATKDLATSDLPYADSTDDIDKQRTEDLIDEEILEERFEIPDTYVPPPEKEEQVPELTGSDKSS